MLITFVLAANADTFNTLDLGCAFDDSQSYSS